MSNAEEDLRISKRDTRTSLFSQANQVNSAPKGNINDRDRNHVLNSFFKFEQHPWDLVGILPRAVSLPNRTNPSACHKDHTPKCDTDYDIHPTPPDLDPYIGPNAFRHLLRSPNHAEWQGNNLPVQDAWLKRFPKKERTKLSACPLYKYGIGWGIELEEELYLNWVVIGVLVSFLLAALIFGICWWKFKGDLQAASSMASLMMAFDVVLVSLMGLYGLWAL